MNSTSLTPFAISLKFVAKKVPMIYKNSYISQKAPIFEKQQHHHSGYFFFPLRLDSVLISSANVVR